MHCKRLKRLYKIIVDVGRCACRARTMPPTIPAGRPRPTCTPSTAARSSRSERLHLTRRAAPDKAPCRATAAVESYGINRMLAKLPKSTLSPASGNLIPAALMCRLFEPWTITSRKHIGAFDERFRGYGCARRRPLKQYNLRIYTGIVNAEADRLWQHTRIAHPGLHIEMCSLTCRTSLALLKSDGTRRSQRCDHFAFRFNVAFLTCSKNKVQQVHAQIHVHGSRWAHARAALQVLLVAALYNPKPHLACEYLEF